MKIGYLAAILKRYNIFDFFFFFFRIVIFYSIYIYGANFGWENGFLLLGP